MVNYYSEPASGADLCTTKVYIVMMSAVLVLCIVPVSCHSWHVSKLAFPGKFFRGWNFLSADRTQQLSCKRQKKDDNSLRGRFFRKNVMAKIRKVWGIVNFLVGTKVMVYSKWDWVSVIDLERSGSYCSSALSLIGRVHIGARALLDINLIWFGYIARLTQWGGGGNFTSGCWPRPPTTSC